MRDVIRTYRKFIDFIEEFASAGIVPKITGEVKDRSKRWFESRSCWRMAPAELPKDHELYSRAESEIH